MINGHNFLPSERHLNAIKSHDRYRHATLVTDNFTVGALAKADLRTCYYLLDCLSEKAYAECIELAWQLTRTWHQPLLESIRYHELPLAEIAQNDLWYVFTGALSARIACEHLLDELQPKRILLFKELSFPTIWYTPGGPFPDVIHAILAWTARSRGIPLEFLSPPAPGVPARSDGMIPLHQNPLESMKAPRCLMAFGSYFDYATLGLLNQALDEQTDTR